MHPIWLRVVGQVIVTSVVGNLIPLENVLYVLGIHKNLISILAFATCGHKILFDGHRCAVYDLSHADATDLTGTLQWGLYSLDAYDKCSDSSAHAHAMNADVLLDTYLWHESFGHLNLNALVRLPQKCMPKKHIYETCLLGKMHYFALPKYGRVGASRKLFLIHSDVCGPMKTTSIDGFYYFFTFINDFTKYTWIFVVKSKSELSTCSSTSLPWLKTMQA